MKCQLLAFYLLLFLGLSTSCQKEEETDIAQLADPPAPKIPLAEIESRNFKMGFSTWPYGPDLSHVDSTYQFIEEHSDIYSEQIDAHIPWSAWINGTTLPQEFVNDIQNRKSKILAEQELILSVSLLNSARTDLATDYNDSLPDYDSLNQIVIRDAYFKHLEYLISELQPNYLVAAMEVNELRIHDTTKWQGYQKLMHSIRDSLRLTYPDLPLSESVTLHNWFKNEVDDSLNYLNEISNYIDLNMDFAAISFYPFFKGLNDSADFQQAFDYLHRQTQLPIGIIETNHLAEDLVVNGLNLNIPATESQQNQYLRSLFFNAYRQDYEFVIWWSHRDYDKLWETFPQAQKDLGKLWRDTGILDEEGNQRPAYETWVTILSR